MLFRDTILTAPESVEKVLVTVDTIQPNVIAIRLLPVLAAASLHTNTVLEIQLVDLHGEGPIETAAEHVENPMSAPKMVALAFPNTAEFIRLCEVICMMSTVMASEKLLTDIPTVTATRLHETKI